VVRGLPLAADGRDQPAGDISPGVEKLGWLVFTGGPVPLNTYNGIVVAGIRGDTLTLRVAELFSLFHTPLAIPFTDLSVQITRWHINDSSYKLTARCRKRICAVLKRKAQPNALRRWSHISICATVEFEPNEYKGANAMIDFMIAISAVKKADAARPHFSSMQ
jgi:hypothetical protein